MTDVRVSRAHAEVLIRPIPDLRVSRAGVEVLYSVNQSVSMHAVVPKTVASFAIDAVVAPADVVMQAVVPATVATFSISFDSFAQFHSVVPPTVASFFIDVPAFAEMNAVVPATVAAFEASVHMDSPWADWVRDLGADVLWWARMDDGPDAATLWDASGNGHHGVYSDPGTWSQQPPVVGEGHSVTFEQGALGFSGHADVDPAGWLDAANGPDEFTLIFWAYRPPAPGDAFDNDHDLDATVEVILSQTTSMHLRVLGGGNLSVSEALVPAGRHMWALTYQVNTITGLKMWRNGVATNGPNTSAGWTPDWRDATLRLGSASIPTDLPMDEALIVGRALSGAELLNGFLAGAVELAQMQAVVPPTVASFVLAPAAELTMDARVPATRAAFSAYTSPGMRMQAVVPATRAAFEMEVAAAVVMNAVVPATTASFNVLAAALVEMQAVVPKTVASFTIVTVREISMQAVVPKTVSSFTITVPRTVQMNAVVPATIASFVMAPEAQITMQAVVPATVASFALTFPPATDRTNRVGGRSRGGLAVANWDPPVVPLPPEYVHLFEGRREVAQAFTVPAMNGTMPVYVAELAEQPRPLDRIVVGGMDVTYFRGVPTPFPGYSLVEPLLYGPTAITFPQIAASFEEVGVGELRWLRQGAKVLIQRIDPNTLAVIATDYKGVVVGFDADGPLLTVQVGGEAQGRAALVNRQVPLWTSFQDIGRYAYSAMKDCGMRLTPYLGPTTGIRLQRFGGQSVMDYISELLARAWTRNGNQWTIMPVADGTDGLYEMRRKDTTTIHATAYADDSRVVASLHRDIAEEPNRIFMTGVSPGGQRIRFGVYPGLKQGPPAPYPYDDGRDFGVGTTNADTDTGDGITVMIGRLIITKYLDQEDTPGGYDAQVERAIRNLQVDAGATFTTGIMDEQTWRALYDLDTTGFSLRWSHIEPAAERRRVRKWNRSGSGGIMSRNRYYEPAALKVDANRDAGSGFTRDQMREYAETELETEDNWTGTLSFPTGALVAGDHTPGDPIVDGDVFRARDLRPGHNISLPLFQGGITPHVAAITVGTDGVVSADVDTRARDAMPVWEVIARNRESRGDLARAWHQVSRSSTMTKDSMGVWDEVGGLLGDTVHLNGGEWTVFPVVAGQEGTVRSLRIRTTPAAEFICAVFGDTIYPARLAALIGNPLTKAGSKRWADETIRDALDRTNLILYVAGDHEMPCGYYPKAKHEEDDPDTEGTDESTIVNDLTGRWEDDASFSYHTGRNPVLYVAVYPDRDTTIPRGRIMWNQLEAGL